MTRSRCGLGLAVAGLFFSLNAKGQPASNQPLDFDYQERTGFPLSVEERIVPLNSLSGEVGAAVRGDQTTEDWGLIEERLADRAPPGRDRVRVVRLFTDQAVYIKDGFALLPDPAAPDAPVNLGSFDVASACAVGGSLTLTHRCISLHRDHEQNRSVVAVFLAARTLIFKGVSQTGGLSLITLSENVYMGRDDLLDLSARQDPAPTFGVGATYTVYKRLPNSPEQVIGIDIAATHPLAGQAPSAQNPWSFADLPDLQWQYDRARSTVPDYDFGDVDPCTIIDPLPDNPEEQAEARDHCYRRRDPRGFAGLPGGDWLALTYRASTVRAVSNGQPGGDGGSGLDHRKDIECVPPPVLVPFPQCAFLPDRCTAANQPSNSSECQLSNAWQVVPTESNICRCDTSCTFTQCSVNLPEQDPTGSCVVTCGKDPFLRGFRGGQAGPGGKPGVIRVSAVVHESGCSTDFSEENLRSPGKAHVWDDRCLDGKPEQWDSNGAADCASKSCSENPDVTVCASAQNPQNGGTGSFSDPFTKDLIKKLTDLSTGPTNLVPDWKLFSPFGIAPGGPFGSGVRDAWLQVSDTKVAVLRVPEGGVGALELSETVSLPRWQQLDSITVPDSLLQGARTFSDSTGELTFPSDQVVEALSRFLGAAANTAGPSAGGTLGFESLSGWTSSAGPLSLSDRASEGSHSLSVPATGWVVLTSAPLPAPLAAPRIAFDLLPPSPAANPWWAGDVSLVVDAPSAGLYSAWLGQVSLQGAPLDQFSHFELPIPAGVASQILMSNGDLRVSLRLNVAAGDGRYLIDALSFGAAFPPSSTESESSPLDLALPLLSGTPLESVALAASGNIRIDDRARVLADGGFGRVLQTGTGEVNLGVEAEAGNIESLGSITLRDRAIVHGAVVARGTVAIAEGAAALQGQASGAGLTLDESAHWTADVPSGTAIANLQPGQSEVLEPGAFTSITVASGATLTLGSGAYFTTSLTLEPGSTLALNATSSPVLLYVRDRLIFRGTQAGTAEATHVLLSYAGSEPVAFEAPFRGTIVAPRASVRLGVGGTAYEGSVFAESIELDPDVELEQRAFAFWSLVAGIGAGQDRLSQLISFVRDELVRANPSGALSFANARLPLEVARLAARTNFRVQVDGLRRVAGQAPVHVTGFDPPGSGWMVGVGGFISVFRPVDPGLRPILCGDTASGGVFTTIPGRPGRAGPGGMGAQKRCSGVHPTFEDFCVRPPQLPAASCTQAPYNAVNCPDDRCVTLNRFPNDDGTCPQGYKHAALSRGLGLNFSVCPHAFRGAGGVQCHQRDGDLGDSRLPSPNRTKSAVHAWTYAQWSQALHELHPLELSRRAGRGNTFYKRDEPQAAAVRYFSTAGMLDAVERGLAVCPNGGAQCCPDDLAAVSTAEGRAVCALDEEIQQRLRQLDGQLNYYGYLSSFVPPTSTRVRDPAAVFDLVTLVTTELNRAELERDRWLAFGNALNQQFSQAAAFTTSLDLQRDALLDATDANGSLTGSVAVADAQIADAISRLRQLHETIRQLGILRTKLRAAEGFEIEVFVKDLVKAVVIATATAYGGPAAGVAAAFIVEGFEQGLAQGSGDAEQAASANASQVSVSTKSGCLQTYKSSGKVPDASKCQQKWLDTFGKQLEPDAMKLFALLGEQLGLGNPQGGNALSSVIIDTTISQLTVEVFHASQDMGQALLAWRIAQEKYNEAVRQIVRINDDRNVLQQVAPQGFPAPEVQLALADLAFRGASYSVDRAGEYFFLLRRGVEREVVPFDPVTGEDRLEAQERMNVGASSVCANAGVTVPSLDVNLVSLPCFTDRVDRSLTPAFAEASAATSIDRLALAETTIPVNQWTLGENESGDPTYFFALSIPYELTSRGERAIQQRQKIYDISFYLDSNDAEPEAIRMKLRAAPSSPDVFYVGKGHDAEGNLVPQFQYFDVARGSGASPGTPLFELLRDRTEYARSVFACNAMTPNSPENGLKELCRLSGLSLNGHAFLEGRSLISELELSVRVQDLEGRQPSQLQADVRYSYRLP